MGHWLEREIAQWVHPMKDRSDDPSHHERTLLPRSYISLPRSISESSDYGNERFCNLSFVLRKRLESLGSQAVEVLLRHLRVFLAELVSDVLEPQLKGTRTPKTSANSLISMFYSSQIKCFFNGHCNCLHN